MEIKIQNLVKQYGSVKALDGLNLTLQNGIYGLLGPNGAGKSTLINILTDNMKRTSGNVLCDGEEITKLGKAYRKRIGYMPQTQSCYDSFSAGEFLEYMAVMKGMQRNQSGFHDEIENVLREVNLLDRRKEKIGSFSGGMKRRILLAQAMLGRPELLILDEPTAGLDPKERIALRNSIAKNSGSRIVLVATHIVSDIESIASQIVLIKQGKIIQCDAPERLLAKIAGETGTVRSREETNLEDLYMYYFGE